MKFWIDMDNAPHVHVLTPLVRELRERGHCVEVTARDYGQTLALLRLYGIQARCVGHHAGANKLKKYFYFLVRTMSLLAYAVGKGYDGALCHGSRSQLTVAWVLRIPIVAMWDYEYVSIPKIIAKWPELVLVPDVIPTERMAAKGVLAHRIVGYPGLKEHLYIHDFVPDPSFLEEMGIAQGEVLILVRPPATMAHYAVKESESFFYEVLDFLGGKRSVQIVLLPRTADQETELKQYVRRNGYLNVRFPDKAYHGPNLIWFSDLVVSGGGTMNREAAALGVPVVSIYLGRLGAVDTELVRRGWLRHVRNIDEFHRVPLVKADHADRSGGEELEQKLREFIVSRILKIAERTTIGTA